MKLSLLALLVVITTAPIFFGQAANTEIPKPVYSEQELIDLSVEWMQAVERKDRAALERLVADDFSIDKPGQPQPPDFAGKPHKQVWIQNAIEIDSHSYKYRGFKVRLYGDMAVVTALLDFKVKRKGGWFTLSSDAEVTDIWVRRDGRWQVVFRSLGEYSIGRRLQNAIGFGVGLAFCFVVWLLLKLRRRLKAKKLARA